MNIYMRREWECSFTFLTFPHEKQDQKPVDRNYMDCTNPMGLVPFDMDLEALDIVS